MKQTITGLAAALFLGAAASAAHADVYTWKITGAFTGSGTFTTSDTPFGDSSAFTDPNTGPDYLLTSLTGTFAGKTVQLAPADPYTAPYYADNLLYPDGIYPYTDDNGLLFETVTNTGTVIQEYNLFESYTCNANGCSDLARIGYPGISGGSKVVTFSITDTTPPAPAPEPASWAVMIAGFGLMGATMRRKKAALRGA